MTLLDNYRYHSTDSSPNLKKACEILQPLGINYFMFYTNFADGRELKCTNRGEVVEAFMDEGWYKKSAFTQAPIQSTPGFYWYEVTENPDIVAMHREKFDLGNMLTWINPSNDACELAHFGTSASNKEIINIYLNHMDLFKRFLVYFKNSMADELSNDKMTFLMPNRIQDNNSGGFNETLSEEEIQAFKKATQIKKFQLSAQYNSEYLTTKECEVLQWLTTGLAIPDIAEKIHNSPRTVEQHVSNLRDKIGVKKKSDLIAFANEHFML